MDAVVSADGTELDCDARGDGPPVVLVHGTSATKAHFQRLADALADDFRVVTYDRRGRGDSGDADDYDFQREVDDLRAVVAAVDGDPVVFGHSFGGLVALEAAAGGLDASRLVLYEPSVLVDDYHTDLAARIRDRVDAGDRVGGVEAFFETVGTLDQVARPVVEQAADIVETIAREIDVVESYDLDAPRTGVPTLLVAGEHGPDHLRRAIDELEHHLEHVERTEVADAGHV
ncbi:MAG: alpha/beta fold hydrolase, partial [Halobacterium sp.]